MKCSICGTESKADARQCERCGASLVVPTFDKTMLLDVRAFRAAQQTGEAPIVRPVAPAAPVVPVAKPVPPVPRRSNRAGVVIAVIALGFAGYLLVQLLSSFGLFSSVPVPRPGAPPEVARPVPGK
jgi:hypothetical protein